MTLLAFAVYVLCLVAPFNASKADLDEAIGSALFISAFPTFIVIGMLVQYQREFNVIRTGVLQPTTDQKTSELDEESSPARSPNSPELSANSEIRLEGSFPIVEHLMVVAGSLCFVLTGLYFVLFQNQQTVAVWYGFILVGSGTCIKYLQPIFFRPELFVRTNREVIDIFSMDDQRSIRLKDVRRAFIADKHDFVEADDVVEGEHKNGHVYLGVKGEEVLISLEKVHLSKSQHEELFDWLTTMIKLLNRDLENDSPRESS